MPTAYWVSVISISVNRWQSIDHTLKINSGCVWPWTYNALNYLCTLPTLHLMSHLSCFLVPADPSQAHKSPLISCYFFHILYYRCLLCDSTFEYLNMSLRWDIFILRYGCSYINYNKMTLTTMSNKSHAPHSLQPYWNVQDEVYVADGFVYLRDIDNDNTLTLTVDGLEYGWWVSR